MPRALAVAAHPDDESYPFGGLLAALAAAGWRCLVLCATAGEAGERHDGGAPGSLGEARLRELETACQVLGVEPPIVWAFPDGGLMQLGSCGNRLARLLDAHEVDLLLSLGPDGAYGHPDHLAVHHWCRDAARKRPVALLETVFPPGLFLSQYDRCRNSGVLGEPPSLSPEQLGGDAPDLVLDLPPALRARKLAAISAHRTQLPDGQPDSLFPPGVVARLLQREAFRIAQDGPAVTLVREVVDSLRAGGR